MTTFERVKHLADQQKMSIIELEERLGFSKNSLYSWKKNKPSVDKLNAVADYFNVSTDYLLGRTDNKYADLSPKKKMLTVREALESTMGRDGEGIDEDDIDVLERIIKAYIDGK